MWNLQLSDYQFIVLLCIVKENGWNLEQTVDRFLNGGPQSGGNNATTPPIEEYIQLLVTEQVFFLTHD